jgi:UDP-N-acetylglucosamine 2-epimerase (hydrolysing)
MGRPRVERAPQPAGQAVRKVLFVTATRADFGKLKPLIAQVKAAPEFEYAIFATGMHLLARYGFTINEIRKSGYERVFSFINQDASVNSQMDLALAHTIQGLGHYIREFPPDLIVVHGDRIEALASAIVGALNNVLVAHIEGGELSGTVDELLRHSISKLSHVHFVANDEARLRLIQMGEAPETVIVIGSPDIDVMLSRDLPSLAEVRRKYEIPFADYGVLLYHPVTTEPQLTQSHAEQVVDALAAAEMNFVAIHPNNDSGAEQIIDVLMRLRDHPRFRILPSLRFEYFLTLLKHARVIAGNSSAGIREAPVYGTPTINIGNRQLNRFRHVSILDVPPERQAILDALARLPRPLAPSLHFGRGGSARRFMRHLRAPAFWRTPRQKQFQDIAAAWDSAPLAARPEEAAP